MPQTTALVASVKHRACDECRTRKLACSKDPGGCGRCKKESLTCHYSEQKPMGRPRKRQFVETEPTELLDEGPLDLAPEPYVVNNDDAYRTTDHLDAFLLNGLSQPGFPGGVDPVSVAKNGMPYSRWQFGRSMVAQPINFGGHVSGSNENHSSSVGSVPQISTGSTSDSSSSSPPAAAVPCCCLASMYLSLASLQQFPTEIVAALKAVRGAAQVAAASIWCPQCGSISAEDPNPSIEGFQNTMLLGTILPIIANSYQRLLNMIDDETDVAVAHGQTKTFQFLDYGGLCGQQSTVDEAWVCAEKDILFNTVEMPPHQWRTTVRALLRIDIYGYDGGGFKHKGLKDIVTEMEFRQRAHHDLTDAHAIAGLPIHGIFGQHVHGTEGANECPKRMHACMQILNIAKLAIDNLVIA